MVQELVEDPQLFGVVRGADRIRAEICADRLVVIEDLLYLDRVVGEELRGRVDGRQAATDDGGRQAHLQIGHRVLLERAGQLQGHEKVTRFADAANEVVLHAHDGRRSGAGSDGDVVESELVEGIADGQRSAETYAAVEADVLLSLQRDADHFQEILVPANGDAVLRHPAEAGQDPVIELVPQYPRVADWLGQKLLVDRLDLQTVDGHDTETFVGEIVSERVAGRSETNHEHVLAVVREGDGAANIQRIPPRHQPVHLESVREKEDIGQHAGFDLRNIDRILLLKNARLHAVVADSMARAWAHRVVEHDHG